MTTTARRTVARFALAGIAAASLGTMVGGTPASAELCVGKYVSATANNQVLHGTCGADEFAVHNYSNVTIYAGDGNDEVKVGWGGGTVTAYLGSGDDDLFNGSDKRVVVFGEQGHDDIEGGAYDDWISGGAGNDIIFGGNGKNVLLGQDGNDTLNSDSYGALKVDTVDGGPGIDSATSDLAIDKLAGIESKKEGSL